MKQIITIKKKAHRRDGWQPQLALESLRSSVDLTESPPDSFMAQITEVDAEVLGVWISEEVNRIS